MAPNVGPVCKNALHRYYYLLYVKETRFFLTQTFLKLEKIDHKFLFCAQLLSLCSIYNYMAVSYSYEIVVNSLRKVWMWNQQL